MEIKQPREFAQGLGIGAALMMIAAGAISFFLRPGPAGLGATAAPSPKPLTMTGELVDKATPLPADYLDICRTAGL